MAGTLLLGAVAYDPKVVTIWDGFRVWLRTQDLDLDYVLYSNYERQAEDLVSGRIDVAWNSPLAWVRARRLAQARDIPLRPVTMRDTDCDLTSVVVVRADSDVQELADLRGRTVATGAVDSPQATLLPLHLLRSVGLDPGTDVAVRRFDIGVGLHGDHVGGERDAALALAAGEVDAACMIDGNSLLFAREGVLPPGARVVGQTPVYDHCTMTAGPSADPRLVDRFGELLLGMSYADPELRPLLDLEGLKEWRPPRLEGFSQLERAVDGAGFYDDSGRVRARDYRP
ncbi:ABC-type phosphate/phosphonate transport system substrate-binding protein [Motilibacter peucedani]|uniref:ABC-type phosphate/phosphonate transport system substrate-binding protein n=1 Tax=Motilibacter peucedani TaxID=598650 RepID=A0A420XT29_9ACTN|nr:phosphate/phosphite/phosphonate ABC transporter substrate-binding protein [Motilibacter peucedani]RKS79911.1 ABC-type phosphate/phosphonate transport system substrate-binding protein [Motilibacter peucedani]